MKMTRKGDLIEFGANGDYRLEQAVIVADDGSEAKHPTLAEPASDDSPPRPWKLTRRVDNEMGVDDNDNPTPIGADGKPTTYTYRYDPVAEFMADDEEAAITEAKRLIAEG